MMKGTSDIQTRYDRIASNYDICDAIPERLFYRSWRRRLWGELTGGRILEIGVGTGKNIYFYPPGAHVIAVDISSKMLEKAVIRTTSRPDVQIELLTMNVSELTFDADVFDAVVGSFILTVLPDPLKVLQEVKRVCKPDGKLLLLEFTRSNNQLISFLQDLVTPLTHAVYRAHLNREILKMIERSGFQIVTTEQVGNGFVKLIRAVLS